MVFVDVYITGSPNNFTECAHGVLTDGNRRAIHYETDNRGSDFLYEREVQCFKTGVLHQRRANELKMVTRRCSCSYH